ncbi:MAG: hypothetical protein FJ143_16210 [Deltaproteobacteria bacterium]|nr:hypothetical protein [Deltaproteobacteria bacterium]
MRYSIKRVSGPQEEPITRASAKLHLRVESDQTADDALIDTLISAAREQAENFTNRCFVYSTWELKLDEFPDKGDFEIVLPRPPLIQVNSIQYVDADGATQTLGSDNYLVDDRAEPAVIRPAYNKTWPATRAVMGAVTVSYVAGYPVSYAGSPADYTANLPAAALAAVKLIVGHLYTNREAVLAIPGAVNASVLPLGAHALLWVLRVEDFRLSA